MTAWLLVASLFLLLLNGFFVAVEFSLIASRRAALEPLAEAGDRRARRALESIGELNLQLAGAQLGVTMASLALGAVAEPTIAHLLESGLDSIVSIPHGALEAIGFIVALVIVVFSHMVLGEMVPKYLAMASPERWLLLLATPNRLYLALFRPMIRILNGLANAIVRLFGVQPRDDLDTAHTAEELALLLATSREAGILEQTAHDLLAGALDFGARPLGSIVTPRDEVVSVPRSATIVEAERQIVEHGVSRLLVLGPGPDDVVGFIHAKDLLMVPAAARNRPLPVARIRRVLVLDAGLPLDAALVAMRRSRTHVAAVLDSGRFTGIATLEDVLEEVVGDIIDESD